MSRVVRTGTPGGEPDAENEKPHSPVGKWSSSLGTQEEGNRRGGRICPLRLKPPVPACVGSPALAAAAVPGCVSDIKSALAPLQILSPGGN